MASAEKIHTDNCGRTALGSFGCKLDCACWCHEPRKPAAEVTLRLDRRELASILAGLRLYLEFAGPGSRDYEMCRLVDKISSDNDTIKPLTYDELRDLVRRLA